MFKRLLVPKALTKATVYTDFSFLLCLLMENKGEWLKKKKKEEREKESEGGTDRSANQDPCPCLIVNLAGKRRCRWVSGVLLAYEPRQGLPTSYSQAGRQSIRLVAYIGVHLYDPEHASTLTADMKLQQLLCIVFFLLASLLPASGQRPGKRCLRPTACGPGHGAVLSPRAPPAFPLSAPNARFLPSEGELVPACLALTGCLGSVSASVCFISAFSGSTTWCIGQLWREWGGTHRGSRQAAAVSLLPGSVAGTGGAVKALAACGEQRRCPVWVRAEPLPSGRGHRGTAPATFLTPCLPLSAANLALRRKLHRHGCSHRRCMPLHSRVPFPWGNPRRPGAGQGGRPYLPPRRRWAGRGGPCPTHLSYLTPALLSSLRGAWGRTLNLRCGCTWSALVLLWE